MTVGVVDPALIGPALEAARKALRELDEEHVPAQLRRVVAWSGRRLPQPLERTLASQLEELEWLRLRALEHLDDQTHELARAFLAQSEDWEALCEKSIAELDAAAQRRVTSEVEADNARLLKRLASVSDELSRARDELEVLRRGERSDAERMRLAAVNRELRSRLEAEEQRGSAERSLRRETERMLEEADARIRELKRRLAMGRIERPDPEQAPARVFGVGDPLALARTLDDLVESLARSVEHTVAPMAVGGLVYPQGLAPDGVGAIEWLLSVKAPCTVLVDGYNVVHGVSSEPDAAVRMRLHQAAVRMRRLADGPLSVVVFWDSVVDASEWRADGVDVRFVPSADDAIVAAAAHGTVVITSDRAVREAAERRGAIGLWSQALLAWM